MNLRTYLMIKQAGNPINKLKLKTFKAITDPAYANKSMNVAVDRLGISQNNKQDLVNDSLKTLYNATYGQDTVPDDVLANPGQALRSRGLDKTFGNDAVYNEMLRLKRNGEIKL